MEFVYQHACLYCKIICPLFDSTVATAISDNQQVCDTHRIKSLVMLVCSAGSDDEFDSVKQEKHSNPTSPHVPPTSFLYQIY